MIAARSLVVRDGIRLATPLAIVVAVALFFAGHNQPGGGFSAGLVIGAIMALRQAVGLPTPQHPVRMMAIGGVIIGAVAVAPLLVGDPTLDQYVWTLDAPVLGKIKAGTALIFDLGVVLIVLGLIVSMLEALGAGSELPDLMDPVKNAPATLTEKIDAAPDAEVAQARLAAERLSGSGRSGTAPSAEGGST
ncbi:MAG: MnhB domain-containing protein [Ilumatobacter sp.]